MCGIECVRRAGPEPRCGSFFTAGCSQGRLWRANPGLEAVTPLAYSEANHALERTDRRTHAPYAGGLREFSRGKALAVRHETGKAQGSFSSMETFCYTRGLIYPGLAEN